MERTIQSIHGGSFSAALAMLNVPVKHNQMVAEALHTQNGLACVVLNDSDDDSFFYEGIIAKSSSELVVLSKDGVTVANIETHELLRVNDKDVNGIEHAQVLDLSDDGERWEGDVLQNKPYGWGVLYDSENRRMYEGFRIGSVNVCYGTQYYSDIQKVEYEGEWCGGKRWGRGVQYDRNGRAIREGEWYCGTHDGNVKVQITTENQSFHSLVTELVVSKGCCNEERWKVLDLSFVTNLERLEVGDDCFAHLEEIRMVGLKHLQKVKIGKNCACSDKKRRKVNPNSRFIVNDCAALQELEIGVRSFPDYVVCDIQNVPSLETIRIGSIEDRSYNFLFSSLELKSGALSVESCVDLPKLTTVEIGEFAFYQCVNVLFESCRLHDASRIDLPELTSIQCGDSSFFFLWDDPSSQLVLRSAIRVPES